MGGIGGGVGFAMLGSVMAATHNPVLGGLTLIGVVGGSFLLAPRCVWEQQPKA